MELLFSESSFSKDFKELLGFVDADIPMRSVRSDLIAATKQMIEIIGKPLYNQILTTYKGLTGDEPNTIDLLYYVRYPIALNCYRLAAPTNDLNHTKNGRLMRVDEHEKQPFEWMIARDDKNQERKYYRAVDDLLNYLEEEDITGWKDSDALKKQRMYFVSSTSHFEDFFPIESRLLLLKLQPAFRKAERELIKTRLGQDKFTSQKEAYLTNTQNLDQDLLELIREVCVYYALTWGVKRLSAQLFPEGVLQQYASDRMTLRAKKVPESMELSLVAQEFNQDTIKALSALEDYVKETQPQPEPDAQEDYSPIENLGFDQNDPFVTS